MSRRVRLGGLAPEEMETSLREGALPLFKHVLVETPKGIYEVWAEGWSVECVADRLPPEEEVREGEFDSCVYDIIHEECGGIVRAEGWEGYLYVDYADDDYPYGVTIFYKGLCRL